MTKRLLLIVLFLTSALVLASCGDDGDSTTPDPAPDDTGSTDTDDTGDSDNPATDFVDDLADDLAAAQDSVGGGSATLTVGDQTWTFDSVLCAFGEEMTGQEGAVFNLSSIQDGMQMYASIDSFGHSVDLNDIEDFENPSVSLSSGFGSDNFIELDGKNVRAEIGFVDGTSADLFAETPGVFTATCP